MGKKTKKFPANSRMRFGRNRERAPRGRYSREVQGSGKIEGGLGAGSGTRKGEGIFWGEKREGVIKEIDWQKERMRGRIRARNRRKIFYREGHGRTRKKFDQKKAGWRNAKKKKKNCKKISKRANNNGGNEII